MILIPGHPESVPNQAIAYLQAKVSLDRIDAFFKEEEIPFAMTVEKQSVHNASHEELAISRSSLAIKNGSFTFSSVKDGASVGDATPKFRLQDINVEITPGKVTVITGDVGSVGLCFLSSRALRFHL